MLCVEPKEQSDASCGSIEELAVPRPAEDAAEFLNLAAHIHLSPEVQTFALEQVNEALQAQKDDRLQRTAVLLPNG